MRLLWLFLPLAVGLMVAACGEPPTIVLETLQVVNMAPSHGAQCVTTAPLELQAEVTFSDDVEPKSLEGNLFIQPEGGGPIAVTIQYDKSAQTARLAITNPLEFEQVYQLVVTEGVEGVQHGSLPAQVSASFRTISAAGCY